MSVRASVICAAVLSLGLTCSAQFNPTTNSSRSTGTNPSATVTGSVLSAEGLPVSDARVEIHDDAGNVVASAFTDMQGNYMITNVAGGRIEVVASKGVNESRERIYPAGMDTQITLRLPVNQAAPDGSTSVSVANFKVPEK